MLNLSYTKLNFNYNNINSKNNHIKFEKYTNF